MLPHEAPGAPATGYSRPVAGRTRRRGAPIAGGIAALLVLGFAVIPAVLAPLLYLFFSIAGFTHGEALSETTVNVPLLIIGAAAIATLLVVLLFGGVSLIGRSLTPKRRRRSERA